MRTADAGGPKTANFFLPKINFADAAVKFCLWIKTPLSAQTTLLRKKRKHENKWRLVFEANSPWKAFTGEKNNRNRFFCTLHIMHAVGNMIECMKAVAPFACSWRNSEKGENGMLTEASRFVDFTPRGKWTFVNQLLKIEPRAVVFPAIDDLFRLQINNPQETPRGRLMR